MSQSRVQSLDQLEAQMRQVARGEMRAPADAAKPSFNSVEALVRLLTPANRQFLAVIRDSKPQSVEELARLTGRASPNVTRTLAKLEAAGLVRVQKIGRRKVASPAIKKLRVDIDPYACNDRFEFS